MLAILCAVQAAGALEEDWFVPFVAILFANFALGARGEGLALVGGAAGVTVLLWLSIALDSATTEFDDYLFVTVFVVALPILAGRTLRNRRLLMQELRAKARSLERDREEQARQAVADERRRISRELHDVVAHSVSVMVVQAGGARRIARSDPERAREALSSVQMTGREALGEMRRMLGMLGEEASRPALAPQPSLASLEALCERARAAGLPVDLRVSGERGALPPGVDLAAYRVIQEALTNTLQHAGPAEAHVRVRYGPGDLELEITDDGRGAEAPPPEPATAGQGLVGMHERLALYDGELQVGPRPGGGYAVRARFPLGARDEVAA
jgi:signal transduction histidine kinase